MVLVVGEDNCICSRFEPTPFVDFPHLSDQDSTSYHFVQVFGRVQAAS